MGNRDEEILDYLVRVGARMSEVEQMKEILLQNYAYTQKGEFGHHLETIFGRLSNAAAHVAVEAKKAEQRAAQAVESSP